MESDPGPPAMVTWLFIVFAVSQLDKLQALPLGSLPSNACHDLSLILLSPSPHSQEDKG